MTARLSLFLAAALALAACGDEPTSESHTPASARLFAVGQELTPNLVLTRGQTVRIEVRFYHDDGDQITGIETEHYAGLSFSPTALATVTPVAGQHFFFDVTVQNAAGSGTVTVGYGHDVMVDELSFGPFQVTVP